MWGIEVHHVQMTEPSATYKTPKWNAWRTLFNGRSVKQTPSGWFNQPTQVTLDHCQTVKQTIAWLSSAALVQAAV